MQGRGREHHEGRRREQRGQDGSKDTRVGRQGRFALPESYVQPKHSGGVVQTVASSGGMGRQQRRPHPGRVVRLRGRVMAVQAMGRAGACGGGVGDGQGGDTQWRGVRRRRRATAAVLAATEGRAGASNGGVCAMWLGACDGAPGRAWRFSCGMEVE